MKKIISSILLIFLYTGLISQEKEIKTLVDLTSDSSLEISGVTVNSERIGQYEKFEITFHMTGKWDNPFDPDQIRVSAVFSLPDGSKVPVPGFFFQEYYRNPSRRLEKIGSPVWKVRYTPVLTGRYSYRVTAVNNGKEIHTPEGSFSCESFNASHGFIKVSKTNPLYLEFTDGVPFFGIGMDRIQADDGGCYQRFAAAGGNFNRLFIATGKVDIQEITPDPTRPDRGLGKMNLENSWNLDKVLELGENLGIYHMITLTNQYNFNHAWDRHTYNKANGGVLDSKKEYFTNEEAMRYFERYLRYAVARWGYSTSVFSWDLWNEYSAMGVDADFAIPWHLRMTKYIRSLDAAGHIIHTNDGLFNGYDKMHALPEMELVSTNAYALKDISYLASVWTRRMIEKFNKPYVLTEYGMGHNPPRGGYGFMDPERRMVHNGLWSPVMNGSAATGMPWEAEWLNSPIFFSYIKAVKKIVHDIPFNKRVWKPVDVASFKFMEARPSYYSDIIVEGWPGNFRLDRESEPETFLIGKDGRVLNQESLNANLTGMSEGRPNSTTEVSFKMEYPVDGEFVVYITELRDTVPTPQLTIDLDGKQELQKEESPSGSEKYHPVMHNQYYTIEIPKGLHTVRISNTGGGQMTTSFELKNYILKNGPDLEIRGLQSDDYILIWLKNQKYTVLHELVGIGFKSQAEGVLSLLNVKDGTWLAEWVNTIDASVIKTELVECRKENLILYTPVVNESITVRLQKVK